jgi:hypothetical protein
MDLKQKYVQAKNTSSDINEHIETFYEYSKNYGHITELGIRSVVSSWGFLYGLYESQSSKKKMVGVDLEWHDNINSLKSLAENNRIEYQFIQGDSAKVDIEETDILFIDTWHIYGHLKRELENHHSKTRHYIMMHDTTIDGTRGETIRCGWNAEEQSKTSGYPVDEIKKGLWPAIDEFLIKHPEWKLHKKYTNNNGLTILKRDTK